MIIIVVIAAVVVIVRKIRRIEIIVIAILKIRAVIMRNHLIIITIMITITMMAASQIIKTLIAMGVVKERTKAAVVQKGMTIRKAEIVYNRLLICIGTDYA
jgi:hypothetical protein